MDDMIHDQEEYERRVQAAHRRAQRDLYLHHLVIQGNNLGVQYPDGRIRTAVIDQLYHQEAPNIPLIGIDRDGAVVRVFFNDNDPYSLFAARRWRDLAVRVPGGTTWFQMRTNRCQRR